MSSSPSSRLHLLGNLFSGVVALTPWLWAALFLNVYSVFHGHHPQTEEFLLQYYEVWHHAVTALLWVCALGGLACLLLGLGQRSRRLVWQGVLGVSVSIAIVCLSSAFAIYSFLRVMGETSAF